MPAAILRKVTAGQQLKIGNWHLSHSRWAVGELLNEEIFVGKQLNMAVETL